MSVSIWYVPRNSDRAYKIDLGSNVSDLFEWPEDLVSGAEALSGAGQTVMFRSRLRVRIALEDFDEATNPGLERKLRTFVTHVNLGGSFAFARTESKAWAGYTSGAKPARSTTIPTAGNTWSFGQSASLTAGDEVVVWGGSPEAFREYTTVSSFTSPTVVLSDGLKYDYKQGPLLVRHRDFYPALRRPVDDRTPLVTHVRRTRFTFEGEFVEDVNMLAEAAAWSPGTLPTTSASGRSLGPDQLSPGITTFTSGKT